MRMKYTENILTFNEWQRSILEEDGRRWRLDEGQDGSTVYVELVPEYNPYDSIGEGAAIARARKIRELFTTRVRRPEKGYITRLSYTRAIAQYHPGCDVPLYSGSSLQRKKKSKVIPWIRRMNDFCRPLSKGRTRRRDLITWRTAGGHKVRETIRSFAKWKLTQHFEVKPNTRTRERYEPGLRIQARQKIYSALSAEGFTFLPDIEKKPVLHYFSDKSKNKFQEDAKAFWRACPERKTFVTLTFVQHVTDEKGVQILNKFLTVARREMPGLQYIWVAEHQPGNPMRTIHFHIIFNRWLKVKRFNPLWVMQQYNAGLRGHRRDGSEITMQELSAAYNNRKVGKLLNPYDIDEAKNISQLSAYLVKYVTKTDPSEAFGCGNWHCSRKISRLFTKAVVGPSTFAYLHSLKNAWQAKGSSEKFPPITYTHPFFSMVKVHNSKLILPIMAELEEMNRLLLTSNWSPGRLIGDMQISEEEYRKIFTIPENKNRRPLYRGRRGLLTSLLGH